MAAECHQLASLGKGPVGTPDLELLENTRCFLPEAWNGLQLEDMNAQKVLLSIQQDLYKGHGSQNAEGQSRDRRSEQVNAPPSPTLPWRTTKASRPQALGVLQGGRITKSGDIHQVS